MIDHDFFHTDVKTFNMEHALSEIVFNNDDKLLEMFVRQRLGQDDAVMCQQQQSHEQLNFHAEETSEIAHNYRVLALFDDIWEMTKLDESDKLVIKSYKGSMMIYNYDEVIRNPSLLLYEQPNYSGYGTVEIFMSLIKKRIIRHLGETNNLFAQRSNF